MAHAGPASLLAKKQRKGGASIASAKLTVPLQNALMKRVRACEVVLAAEPSAPRKEEHSMKHEPEELELQPVEKLNGEVEELEETPSASTKRETLFDLRNKKR